ncbi:MAG: hypothetical protein NC432_06720 [Roseburia sp.]|nr:hypothetical protein [Roseburia sp.]MCM1097716.1 hypothetical protein [Ruminococcus flavefaciens]
MDIKQKTETLTAAYIHSYNIALKEVRNPNLAAQIATAVIMVIDLNMPKQQSVNPLELLFAQMATVAQEQREKEESEESNHDRPKDAGN